MLWPLQRGGNADGNASGENHGSLASVITDVKGRILLMLAAAVATLIGASSVALAKGPLQGFVFDGYFIPGEHVSAQDVVRVSSPLFAQRAPYFAFLQNRDNARVNFGWPSPRLAKPIPLGRVDLRRIRHRGKDRVEASLSFRVPDLSPGLYDVVICDIGCDHEVKRLGPSGLYVVSGGTERRLRKEIDNLYSELSRWENRVVRLSGRGPGLSEGRWRVRTANLAALEEEVDTLREQVTEASRTTDSSVPWSTPAIIGALVAAIVGLLWAGRLSDVECGPTDRAETPRAVEVGTATTTPLDPRKRRLRKPITPLQRHSCSKRYREETDTDELDIFCRDRYPKLVGILSLYCGSADVAEELAQDALMRTVRDWRKVQKMNSPEAWLHRVALNLANSFFRRRAAEARAKKRLAAEPQRFIPTVNPGDLAVRQAVATLPSRQKTALALRYFAGLSVRETAEVLVPKEP